MRSKNKLNKKEINKIFEILHEINPKPTIELDHSNAFTLLISVILSAQSTDKMVNICTKDLYEKYDNPQSFILLGYDGLVEYIKKIGLYRNKAKNIIKTCHKLLKDHDGEVPGNYEDLIKLNGVGRKTADVVLNSWFNQNRIAVDRHIYRIVHRIGFAFGKNTDEVSDMLMAEVPKKWHKYCHHWLVLHGRHICKAQKPSCAKCPIKNICLSYQKDLKDRKKYLANEFQGK